MQYLTFLINLLATVSDAETIMKLWVQHFS